jgi:hypothetical protein
VTRKQAVKVNQMNLLEWIV